MSTPALRQLIRHLSPDERIELEQIADYLSEHATPGRNSKPMPEGSVARVINGASPNVRHALQTLSQTLDTPRTLPFQPKLTQEQIANTIGLDPRTTAAIKQRLEDEDIAAGLQAKMGTDASDAWNKPLSPPTDREIISAAVDAHGGTVTQDFHPGMAGAADHRPLRDAIEIISEYTT